MAKKTAKKAAKAAKSEASKHEVWFLWGEEAVKEYAQTGKASASNLCHYRFDTHEELNAFLAGVSAAVGFLESEQFDTKPETV